MTVCVSGSARALRIGDLTTPVFPIRLFRSSRPYPGRPLVDVCVSSWWVPDFVTLGSPSVVACSPHPTLPDTWVFFLYTLIWKKHLSSSKDAPADVVSSPQSYHRCVLFSPRICLVRAISWCVLLCVVVCCCMFCAFVFVNNILKMTKSLKNTTSLKIENHCV